MDDFSYLKLFMQVSIEQSSQNHKSDKKDSKNAAKVKIIFSLYKKLSSPKTFHPMHNL